MAFQIKYSPEAETHLRSLTSRQKAQVLDAVTAQLAHEPSLQTRNRKPMRANPLAGWELRIGTLRVYYDVEEHPEQVVYIKAVGVKMRNRLYINKKETEL